MYLYASNYIQKLKTKQLKFAITVNFRICHQTIYVYASNERCDRICVSRWLQKAAPFSVLLSSTLQILKEFRPFIAAFGATPLQGIAMASISALYFHRALLFNTRMKEDVIRYVDASVRCNEELTCSAYPIWV
ncbi:hypothetical protein GQX74_001897 [Glossina fuscipes]|nr:hypothetical protein GQX74_001897 [Glossina fuscipes]